MIQAVIFDLDGVIVDTVPLACQANQYIANLLGVALTPKDNDEFRGVSRMDIIDKLIHRSGRFFSHPEKMELSDLKNRYYQQLIRSLSPNDILPGISQFMDELHAHQIKLALASSSTNANTVLKKINLFSHFDYIVDASRILKGKPNPEIFLTAAKGLLISPSNCVAIEDSRVGIIAIKEAQMFSVGIGKETKNEHPNWYIETTASLTWQLLYHRFLSRLKDS